ncbi:hypothetical protein CI109_105996 [Kwoniella shandongensis]|uniref:Uncharacterized protein n=1 Tax=Kwoniella shandongensis TaxID=1734106 RepID=A0A5M6BXW7_9TREE|nr:uncharacterized protein CI109_003956 [Kwoniella shandongensis]KAA5527697.1 hypothetical protein CI109_003956 [Kwoniella shandongensis]
MSNPPAYLVPVLEKYPLQAGPLLNSLYDISLSVGWIDLRVMPLEGPGEGWVVLLGHKRKEDPIRAVLPLPLHTTSLHPSSLKSIFASLSSLTEDTLPPTIPPFAPSMDELRNQLGQKSSQPQAQAQAQAQTDDQSQSTSVDDITKEDGETKITLDMETLYLAITTQDSTVVYYKLSKGIKKPADVPDE